jgi:hypothetical protein
MATARRAHPALAALDWTFAGYAGSYTARTLTVFARQPV